jgi:hypothetical protein
MKEFWGRDDSVVPFCRDSVILIRLIVEFILGVPFQEIVKVCFRGL